MTYKEKLDNLLFEAIERSNAFIEAARANGMLQNHRIEEARVEWEASENAYSSMLNLIKCNQVNVNDQVPEGI